MDNHHQRHPRREYRRRKANLPKHNSLPGLHLVATQQQLFHCNRCGFISTLLPLCLWCTWALNEAGRVLQPSKTPTRRVSSPSLLFMHVESPPSQRILRGSTKEASVHHDPHSTSFMSSYPPSVALAANVLQDGFNRRDQRKPTLSSSLSLSDMGGSLGRPLSLESAVAFNSTDNGSLLSKNISTSAIHTSSGQPPNSLPVMCTGDDHVYPPRRVITNELPDVDIPHWSNVTTATSANVMHKAGVSAKRYRPTHPPALSNPQDVALALAQAPTPQEEVANTNTDLSEDPSRLTLLKSKVFNHLFNFLLK